MKYSRFSLIYCSLHSKRLQKYFPFITQHGWRSKCCMLTRTGLKGDKRFHKQSVPTNKTSCNKFNSFHTNKQFLSNALCTNHERWPNTSFFWLYLVNYRLWVWSCAWCGCSAWFPCRSGARLQLSDPAIRWMFIITCWKYWLSWSLSPFCTGWPRPLEYKPRNRKVD